MENKPNTLGPTTEVPEHSKMSPSGAERWATCTSSVVAEEAYPEQAESVYAAEGTEAHSLLERAVKAVTWPSKLEPDHPAAQHVDVMYELVVPYLENPRYIVLSEVKVTLCDDCDGTADIIVIDLQDLVMSVADYKHGKGILVEVPNLQTEIYLAAALKSLAWMFLAPMKKVIAVIVQPRARHPEGPIRTKIYTTEEITQKGEMVITIVEAVKAGRTKFRPSEKACRWCRASGDCQPQTDACLKATAHFGPIASGDTKSRLVIPDKSVAKTMSVEDRVAIFHGTKAITDFLKAVSKSLHDSLMSGQDIPSLKVVAGSANRKFGKINDEGKIVDMTETEIMKVLTEECKLKKADIAPPKLLGPAPIGELIDPKKRGAKSKFEALNKIIVKPEGKHTVVSIDAPGKSIAPHFEKVEGAVTDPLA
jgi:hypothetical protein